MERPYSDIDPQFGSQSTTAANLSMDTDVITTEPLSSGTLNEPIASGPDLAAAPNRIDAIRSRALETFGVVQARSQDFIREADLRTRQNPWIAVAAASASALALGLVVGRLLKRPDDFLNEEYPSGYDE